mmetsp:Transcript_39672/g.46371  ORF Transcript_39672/g.46371 Transcript_39672/m.46371 type:complete len:249 (+) Transcript_39672:294-1040(+)
MHHGSFGKDTLGPRQAYTRIPRGGNGRRGRQSVRHLRSEHGGFVGRSGHGGLLQHGIKRFFRFRDPHGSRGFLTGHLLPQINRGGWHHAIGAIGGNRHRYRFHLLHLLLLVTLLHILFLAFVTLLLLFLLHHSRRQRSPKRTPHLLTVARHHLTPLPRFRQQTRLPAQSIARDRRSPEHVPVQTPSELIHGGFAPPTRMIPITRSQRERGVQSRELQIGVGRWRTVPLHIDQPGCRRVPRIRQSQRFS